LIVIYIGGGGGGGGGGAAGVDVAAGGGGAAGAPPGGGGGGGALDAIGGAGGGGGAFDAGGGGAPPGCGGGGTPLASLMVFVCLLLVSWNKFWVPAVFVTSPPFKTEKVLHSIKERFFSIMDSFSFNAESLYCVFFSISVKKDVSWVKPWEITSINSLFSQSSFTRVFIFDIFY